MALFSIDVHHHVINSEPSGSLAIVLKRLELIMATQAELQAQIEALTAQADKAKGEIVAKIAKLQEAIDAADKVDPGVLDAFAGLKAVIQGVDDIVPDEPPAE
jgi:hypothetical protein